MLNVKAIFQSSSWFSVRVTSQGSEWLGEESNHTRYGAQTGFDGSIAHQLIVGNNYSFDQTIIFINH